MANRIPIEIGEWYHCFNRGTDRRKVFLNQRDYDRFMILVRLSALAAPRRAANIRKSPAHKAIASMYEAEPIVEIGAYCLMPNHVHFVIKETVEGGISSFMQRVFTGYTMYFNKRHERTGGLFAGTFKSKHLATDRYFKHAINYVHMNPIELFEPDWKQGAGNIGRIEEKLRAYRYSSLQDHLGIERPENTILGKEIFSLFDAPSSLSPMLFDAQAYYRDVGHAVP